MEVKAEKCWRVKRRHLGLWIGLDSSLLQKTAIITHQKKNKKKKRTVQPGDAYEDTTFEPVFEIVKF
jgi:hypothetical protein